MPYDVLLGHIIYKESLILVDLEKVTVILNKFKNHVNMHIVTITT